MSALTQKGVTAWTVGRIAGQSSGRIVVTRKGKAAPVIAETPIKAGESRQSASTGTEPCCDESQISSDDKKTGIKGDIAHAAQAFGTLMKVTAAGGAIDSRTKELINFALAVLSRCGPCLVEHVKKAHGMGIAREQLDEAAWCAVAMGGAPVRMFYQSMMEEISSGGSKGCCS